MPITSSPLNAIQKACGILRALSAKAPLRLSEITATAGLNKVTTLRILDTLVQEGFVRRLDDEASYVLGPEIQAMIAPLQQPSDIREMARPSLVRLATLSEDTVLLSVRSGNEAVCIDREVGSFPIRANYLDFGSRRPLGVGAGSLALLAWAQDREIDAVLEALAPQLKSYPRMTPEIIKAEVATAREQGYTLLCDKVVDGMAAIGIPVFQGSNRVPMAAISIAALSDRIRTRVPELLDGLRREAEFIARAFDLPASRAPSRPSQRRKAK